MNCVAVISCYDKNIEWTQKLLELNLVYKIYVYSHNNIIPKNNFIINNPQYHYEEIPNKGCEASAYLKFIVDNYNNLPNKIILLHDEEYSWHHVGSIIDIIKNNLTLDYRNLNNYIWEESLKNFNGEYDYLNNWDYDSYYYKMYKRFLEPYYGDIQLFLDFLSGHRSCAQFIINSNRILRNPINLYEKLYNYCLYEYEEYGHVPFGFGYFMEYTWHIIFGRIVPLNQIMKGTWKYSARFVHMNDTHIFAEFCKLNGDWTRVNFLISKEEFIENVNGIPVCKGH